MKDTCRIVDVDGTTVRIRGNGKPLTPTDVAALAELVAVVKAMPPDPARDARYAEARGRVRERNARILRDQQS